MRKFVMGIILGALVSCGVCFASCDRVGTVADSRVYHYVDSETGIEYIILERNDSRSGVAITPRLSANGNPIYRGSDIVE